MKPNNERPAETEVDSDMPPIDTTSASIAANPLLPAGWSTVSETPPDELVKVIDKNGRKGFAYPTYYPFKTGQPTGGKWTSPVIPCEPYWDGGWMVSVPKGKLISDLEEIVGWRRY